MPETVSLPLAPTWIEVSRSPARRPARDHALVLTAMGIPHAIAESDGAFLVLVQSSDGSRASEELARYDRENRGWPPREEALVPVSDGVPAAIGFAALAMLAFVVERNGLFGVDWIAEGRVRADLVRAGELWRCVTALSLHADVLHLAGNLVFGAAFGLLLAHAVGAGWTWLGFVVAGGLGNLANAWIQPVTHASIGASTGIFGLLGMLIAWESMRRRAGGAARLRRWAPLVVGAVLLGFVGMGGSISETDTVHERIDTLQRILDRVDVIAHLCGFAAGLALGLGLALARLRPRRGFQTALAWCAPLLVALAWSLALAA